jgi:hypothetical protein
MDGNFSGIYQSDLLQAQYQKRFGTQDFAVGAANQTTGSYQQMIGSNRHISKHS